MRILFTTLPGAGHFQPLVARQMARLGVGPVLGPAERTPAAIRAAARTVLADPAYQRNAARVRDEMAALPGPNHAVQLLERLAKVRRPLVSARSLGPRRGRGAQARRLPL